ncbi:MAG TPA: hypothetical protein VIY49_31475 [Bryobacteraceae bacterium]
MARYMMILAAFLCTASTVAFLYYVPALPVFAVALVLIGFALMFLMGVQVGSEQENPTPSGTNYLGMTAPPGQIAEPGAALRVLAWAAGYGAARRPDSTMQSSTNVAVDRRTTGVAEASEGARSFRDAARTE